MSGDIQGKIRSTIAIGGQKYLAYSTLFFCAPISSKPLGISLPAPNGNPDARFPCTFTPGTSHPYRFTADSGDLWRCVLSPPVSSPMRSSHTGVLAHFHAFQRCRFDDTHAALWLMRGNLSKSHVPTWTRWTLIGAISASCFHIQACRRWAVCMCGQTIIQGACFCRHSTTWVVKALKEGVGHLVLGCRMYEEMAS